MSFLKPERTIFNQEHISFREAVRDFLLGVAVPRAAEWKAQGIIDRSFWQSAAAQGLVGFEAPKEYGGLGINDFRFNAILNEEVVYSGIGTDAFALTNDMVGPYLFNLTSDDQKARWLPGVTSGNLIPAIAMSEPGAGSDLRGIKSVAKWDGTRYLVSGSKTFITSGIQADLVVVAARVDRTDFDGIGLFVIEWGMEGFTKGNKMAKVGRLAQDTAELFFDEVSVPENYVLGDPDAGLRLMMSNLPRERLSIAVMALANAEHTLQFTVDYALEREAFGQRIGSFQANRFSIAEMATEIRVGRAYIDQCLVSENTGQLTAAEAAGAKFWATELEWRVVDQCLQLHGGYGYMEEYEISTRWRDARVQRIYGGTTEIMKEIVGRSLGL